MFLMVHKKTRTTKKHDRKQRMDRTSYTKSTFSLKFPDIRRLQNFLILEVFRTKTKNKPKLESSTFSRKSYDWLYLQTGMIL